MMYRAKASKTSFGIYIIFAFLFVHMCLSAIYAPLARLRAVYSLSWEKICPTAFASLVGHKLFALEIEPSPSLSKHLKQPEFEKAKLEDELQRSMLPVVTVKEDNLRRIRSWVGSIATSFPNC